VPQKQPIRPESVTRAAQRGPTSVNRVIAQSFQVLAGLVLGALGQRAVEAFDQKRQGAAEVRHDNAEPWIAVDDARQNQSERGNGIFERRSQGKIQVEAFQERAAAAADRVKK
jgi:hypothetical protein